MATKKKLLQAAAGSAGGAGGLDIPDVFSTYLYEGASAAQTITNGVDLAGEGGMVWGKQRTGTGYHWIFDTERGHSKWLYPNDTMGEQSGAGGISSFNSDGFDLQGTSTFFNGSGQDYASWTWRKAPKFFDVVTYTGDGVLGRTVNHSLDSEVGMIFVKQTDAAGEPWYVYHRSLGTNKRIFLNTTGAAATSSDGFWTVAPTSTEFSVAYNGTNKENATYVAYLFAHNDGDGEFGPDGDADIIKCGSYVGDDQDDGPEIDLGFEPQWLLVKNASSARNWVLVDNMRGIVTGGTDANLYPNTTSAEDPANGIRLTPTGFKCDSGGDNFNGNGHTMIYMAIRRGQLAVPEDATDVFAIDTRTAVSSISGTDASFYAGFAPDMALWRTVDTSANNLIAARLIQSKLLYTNLTNAESSSTNGAYYFDKENGWFSLTSADADSYSWMWKRAPGFFDVVAYTGDGTANQTFNHNLTVKPDMVWIKNRGRIQDWWVALDDSIVNLDGNLNSSGDFGYSVIGTFTDTTVQTLNTNQFATNYSGDTYIAYLFASLPGISKVGSYTGTGATLNIDCGFTSGARFVLLKKTSSTGHWIVFDTARGIVSGNDPFLQINRTSAEVTAYDVVDPYSSGFTLTSDPTYGLNTSGASYIFYAIA